MARKYYTLLSATYDFTKTSQPIWRIEFGDYDRQCVQDEADELNDKGTRKKDLKIITTDDKQADIAAVVAKLNEDRSVAVSSLLNK